MKYLVSDEAERFVCAGPACPRNCCTNNWKVPVDERTARRYESAEGPLGDLMRQSIDRSGAGARLRFQDGKCPLLSEEGWCRVHRELGEEALCYTCRIYPRIESTEEDLFLYSLTLSCPEAARQILSRKEPLAFFFSEDEKPAPSVKKQTDWELFNLFTGVLSAGTAVLQNRSLAIGQRQRLLLLLGRSLQDALDAGEMEKARQILAVFSAPEEYASLASGEGQDLASKVHLLSGLYGIFSEMDQNSQFYETFQKNAGYLLSGGADYAQFFRLLSVLDETPCCVEQEHILTDALFKKCMDYYEKRDVFPRAVLVIMINQVYRVFTAIASMQRGALIPLTDRAVILADIVSSFEHWARSAVEILDGLLQDRGLSEMEYLFRLVS